MIISSRSEFLFVIELLIKQSLREKKSVESGVKRLAFLDLFAFVEVMSMYICMCQVKFILFNV